MVETPRAEPLTAVAVEGVVLVEGDGVALTLTVEAAALTSDNLLAACERSGRASSAANKISE